MNLNGISVKLIKKCKNRDTLKLEEFEEKWEEVFEKEVVKIKGLEYKPE